MKTKLYRRSLFGHSGQVIAALMVSFVALSFPIAPRAFAQDQDRVISAVIMNIWISSTCGQTTACGGELTIRVGKTPMRFKITEKTRWIGLSGQKLHDYDVWPLQEVHVSVK